MVKAKPSLQYIPCSSIAYKNEDNLGNIFKDVELGVGLREIAIHIIRPPMTKESNVYVCQ